MGDYGISHSNHRSFQDPDKLGMFSVRAAEGVKALSSGAGGERPHASMSSVATAPWAESIPRERNSNSNVKCLF